MAYLVELPIGDPAGGEPEVVKVEIEQIDDGLVRVARPGHVVARATRSQGLAHLAPASRRRP